MTDSDPPDAVVALRCQLGDVDAWELLVHRWHPRLWRFIYRMFGDTAATDDVLQSVWLRVIRSMARLREPERLAAWLYSIARRTAADRLRKQYRRPPTIELVEIPDEVGVDKLERAEDVHFALEQLHPIDREAVALYYLEELSVTDVAEICGVPPGTIKSRLHRARHMLREILTD